MPSIRKPEFEICTVNYGSDLGITQDTVEIFQAGIMDAGYVVRYSADRFYADRVHLLFDRLQPELLDFLVGQKIRFGLFVSEEISPDGAFGWSAAEHGGDPYEMGRNYAKQIAAADFVWCFFERSLEFCRKHNPRVGLVSYGFSPRLLPRYPINWPHRDIPGLITGGMTPHRAEVQQRCQELGIPIQHAGHPLPCWVRDAYLSRAHLHIAPNRTSQHSGYVNLQRVVQSVCFKVALLLELAPGIPAPFAEFYDSVAPGDIPARAIELYSDLTALRKIVDDRLERFADTCSMAKRFSELIETTVSG